MKIKFNSDDDLSLKKTRKFRNMTIVARYGFYEGRQQILFTSVSDECLYKL